MHLGQENKRYERYCTTASMTSPLPRVMLKENAGGWAYENQRAEYAQRMLKLLHAGGMMSVDEVGLFGHRIRLLYPPELDETGRAWGCYNYFENDFWESWGLNANTGTFSSNKIGGGAFRTAVLAGYVLTALYSQSYGIVTVDGSYVRERRLIGWINGVLGAQHTNRRATQLWEVEKLLHKDGCGEYNRDLTGLIHDVPTVCADLEQVESYPHAFSRNSTRICPRRRKMLRFITRKTPLGSAAASRT